MSDEDLGCRQPDVDPEWWFKGPQTMESHAARKACMRCPLYWDCRKMALTEGIPWGIYGGLDGEQRARIWKRQKGGKPRHFERVLDWHLGALLMAYRNATSNKAVATR